MFTVKRIGGGRVAVSELLTKDDMEKAGQMAGNAIVQNIRHQQQADGQPIKRNSKVWLMFKRRMGWGSKSLIAEKKRLVKPDQRSFMVTRSTSKSATIEPIPGDTRDITQWVQENGYTGWFAVGKKQLEIIRRFLFRQVAAKMRKSIGAK